MYIYYIPSLFSVLKSHSEARCNDQLAFIRSGDVRAAFPFLIYNHRSTSLNHFYPSITSIQCTENKKYK